MVEAFHRPKTIAEAVALWAHYEDRAGFVGGGTALSAGRTGTAPAHLISLAGLGLDAIDRDATATRLGAGCTLQRIIDDARVPAVLREAAGHLANRNVRNVATLGGHLATDRPVVALAPVLVALEAQVELTGPDGASRTVSALDYLGSERPGLITGVVVPEPGARRAAVARAVRSSNAMSTVSVAVSVAVDGERPSALVIAVGGTGLRVSRLRGAEAALDGVALSPAAVEEAVQAEVSATADLRGSAELKKHLAGVLVAGALAAAMAADRGEAR